MLGASPINDFVEAINDVLFSNYVVYVLLGVGILFTIWSGFGQYRALTHGAAVVRGKYDDKNDPGAINHFQALSAALSATVGLGNIAGVALAVALGGPGAILWMWLIGFLGMSLKMTEVTQSMLYRNTDDPDNPHGGPMFVIQKGFKKYGLGGLGAFIGGVFVITLITSAITGGNMFQAWNVADITNTYFAVPQVVSGIILTVVVALVIIGGIKRIGAVAGRVVPFMCIIYMLAAGYVLVVHFTDIPAMLRLIVVSGLPTWLGGANAEPAGAFLGGTFGYAAMWGVKRALFSSEAGQGSSPIAHSAAKTDEPVREGVVAGLEPFIDTIVVCTLTALVILASGAYNRGAEADFADPNAVSIVFASNKAAVLDGMPEPSRTNDGEWQLPPIPVPNRIAPSNEPEERTNEGWRSRDPVFLYGSSVNDDGEDGVVVSGRVTQQNNNLVIAFEPFALEADAITFEQNLYHGAAPSWKLDTPSLPRMNPEARRIRQTPEERMGWRSGEVVFMVLEAEYQSSTGSNLIRVSGRVAEQITDDGTRWNSEWNTVSSKVRPSFRDRPDGTIDLGIYGDYAGASLTAHAFDRVAPGLGKWLVTIACWLFAISTMISWSYYGEQGVYYLCGKLRKATTEKIVLVYKLTYCALITLTTIAAMPIIINESGQGRPLIGTDAELDMWTTLGLGVMLWANIPIMLIFGRQAMKAYHEYIRRLKSGEIDRTAHEAPKIIDVVEGKDVE